MQVVQSKIVVQPALEAELIGPDDQVSQSQFTKSVQVSFTDIGSFDIYQVGLVSHEAGTGQVLVPALDVYLFSANPSLASGAASISKAVAKTVFGHFSVAVGEWITYGDGAMVLIKENLSAPKITTFWVAAKLAAGSTQYNSAAGDEETLDIRFWRK